VEIGKRLKLKFGEDLEWKLEKHTSHVDTKVDYYRLAINMLMIIIKFYNILLIQIHNNNHILNKDKLDYFYTSKSVK